MNLESESPLTSSVAKIFLCFVGRRQKSHFLIKLQWYLSRTEETSKEHMYNDEV